MKTGTRKSGASPSTFHYQNKAGVKAGVSFISGGAQSDSGSGGSGCTWGEVSETRYVYDGMRVIQERNSNNVPTVSYTRGDDLSVSLEGAGGSGGLLARSSGYSSGNWTTHADYYADGNGNITSLIDGSQNVVASYRYDPFGNIISKSGSLADANVYRFSSLLGNSGTLTVNTTGAGASECSATAGTSGHAWITYTPDNGETTSYGTWGSGTFDPSDLSGLHVNGEKTRHYRADATASAHLTDAQEKALLDFIKQYDQKGADAWHWYSPCTSLAAGAWQTATGDKLSLGVINSPHTLATSIEAAVVYRYDSPTVLVPVSPSPGSNITVNTPILNLPRP